MSEGPQADIFISYGREEGVKDLAKRLYTDLKNNGFKVWLDVESIPVGSSFPDEIGIALDHCKALIAIMTKKYVCDSDYCKKELCTAVAKKKAVYPVIYEDSHLWESSDKGAGVRYMTQGLNRSMFRPGQDDYSISLKKLVEALKGVVMTPGEGVDEVDVGVMDVGVVDVGVEDVGMVKEKDSRIKMSQLDSIKTKDGTQIKIIEGLSNSWEKFGCMLDFDSSGRTVRAIEKDKRGKTEDCLREVLSRWLDREEKQPPTCTWRHLIELIEDCELGYLASQIKGLFLEQ